MFLVNQCEQCYSNHAMYVNNDCKQLQCSEAMYPKVKERICNAFPFPTEFLVRKIGESSVAMHKRERSLRHAEGGARFTGSTGSTAEQCQRCRFLHSNNVGTGGEGLM